MERGRFMTELRDYQERAVEAVYRHLRLHDDNPCVVVPTGGGKTPIIGRLCTDTVKEWGGSVVILAHVKELLEQSLKHVERDAPGLPIGIYSAGLGAKDLGYPVTIAGIQSAYRNADAFPPPNLVIVDEAHRIPPDGEGMYRTFIQRLKAKNPELRVVGFTATPYRTSTGAICTTDGLLNRICFEVGIRELIAKGYLSKLISKGPTEETDFSKVAVARGEFVQDELEELMSDAFVVGMAVSDILSRAQERRSILIFCSGVKHGQLVARILREQTGEAVGEVYGDTPADERGQMIRAFREGKLRWLVNVEVLTLGFDAPNVDLVALMRATMSPGLYYQMVGRGFRIAEGKADCLILDFGGNVLRHGPVDTLEGDEKKDKGQGEAPVKKCPSCGSYVPTGCLTCPDCGHQFPPREQHHDTKASNASVLSKPEEVDVLEITYSAHPGRDSGIVSLRVDYKTGFGAWVSEFVCIQHTGYAQEKARAWWQRRTSLPFPASVDEALAVTSQLTAPKGLLVSYQGKYPRILAYHFEKVHASGG